MAIAQDKFLAERVRRATRNAVGFPNPINKQFRDISPVVESDPALAKNILRLGRQALAEGSSTLSVQR
jgi:hypothetical protein